MPKYTTNQKEAVKKILKDARDKYTVHDCSQCTWRKCCELNAHGFNSAECRKRRQSIELAFGIDDGYCINLLDRIEAALELADPSTKVEAPNAEISEGKRKLMNELYHTAIDFRRSQLKFFDRVSSGTLKQLEADGKILDSILTRINSGKLPYIYESPGTSVCKTAKLLAGMETLRG